MEWISVNNYYPQNLQAVIYYFEGVGVHRGQYSTELDDNDNFISCFSGKSGWLCDDVTHWMPDNGQPLPEPPKD